MKNYFLTLIAVCFILFTAKAQAPAQSNPPKNTQKIAIGRMVHTDTAVVTKHTVTIKGQSIPYTATAGMMPIWDEEGRPTAGVFYTYYERDDVKDR
ncbi:MAG TPA: hypothetical protein VFE54_14475, partial [Mucilaginibacter sp.]|nr:hypothetical protein [Mucilaginibacter sp.]